MKAIVAIGGVLVFVWLWARLADRVIGFCMDDESLTDDQLPEVMDGAFVVPPVRR